MPLDVTRRHALTFDVHHAERQLSDVVALDLPMPVRLMEAHPAAKDLVVHQRDPTHAASADLNSINVPVIRSPEQSLPLRQLSHQQHRLRSLEVVTGQVQGGERPLPGSACLHLRACGPRLVGGQRRGMGWLRPSTRRTGH